MTEVTEALEKTVSEKIEELKKSAEELPNTRAREMFVSVCDILNDLKEHIAYLTGIEAVSVAFAAGQPAENVEYVCEDCKTVLSAEHVTDEGVVCPNCGKFVEFG